MDTSGLADTAVSALPWLLAAAGAVVAAVAVAYKVRAGFAAVAVGAVGAALALLSDGPWAVAWTVGGLAGGGLSAVRGTVLHAVRHGRIRPPVRYRSAVPSAADGGVEYDSDVNRGDVSIDFLTGRYNDRHASGWSVLQVVSHGGSLITVYRRRRDPVERTSDVRTADPGGGVADPDVFLRPWEDPDAGDRP